MISTPPHSKAGQSSHVPESSKIIMAGNSIGHPMDLPQRSLEALRSSDLLVFEEDRPARAALKAAGIHRPYYKFNEHNQTDTLEIIRDTIRKGKSVCYMSDQGSPTVADPGKAILKIAYSLGCTIQIIPGPSSITAALSACPFLDNSFYYAGFLSRDKALRSRELRQINTRKEPVVFLEAPYRRNLLISQCIEHLGENREALLALDISGPNEAFINRSLRDLRDLSLEIKGKINFVLIVNLTTPK